MAVIIVLKPRKIFLLNLRVVWPVALSVATSVISLCAIKFLCLLWMDSVFAIRSVC